MAKLIGFNNDKGGSGKTFNLLNLAKGLSDKGRNVLTIDLDPQGNASYKFFDDFEYMDGIEKVIDGNLSLREVINHTPYEHLDIVTANKNLRDSIVDKVQYKGREVEINKTVNDLMPVIDQIMEVSNEYDYILFDNNPQIQLFLEFCATVCDLLIIPVNVDLNSVKGVDITVDGIVRVIESQAQAGADIKSDFKILLGNINKRTNLGRSFIADMQEMYKGKIYETVIRYQSKPASSQVTNSRYFVIDHQNTGIGKDFTNWINEVERSLS